MRFASTFCRKKLAMTATFAAFTAPGAPVHLPGAAFVLSAALMGLCAAVFLNGRLPAPRPAPAA